MLPWTGFRKQRTKEEFTRNINQILEGRNYHDRKFGDVMLDLRCQSSLHTLKLMMARLLGTDYVGRKAACTETVETNSPACKQSEDDLTWFGE